MSFAGSWLDWGWVDSNRIGGRRVEIRWDGYFSPMDGIHRGQVRFEDGRGVDIFSRHEDYQVFLSYGYGDISVESNGSKYDNIFDLVMGKVSDELVLRRSNVIRKKVIG